MSSVRTDAIVLRHANYSESSRMVTLLSPSLGLVSASAKGCRRSKSQTLAATELFSAGEYVLFQHGDRYTLTSFALQESYYPIRTDVDKLAHGVYWLNLCEAVAQPGEDCARLFKMLLLSLAVQAYDELPPRALTAVFLVQFAGLAGFAPRLDRCSRCGRPVEAPCKFDAELGGVCCASCSSGGNRATEETLKWLREAQAKGAFVLAGKRALPDGEGAEESFALVREHVEQRLDRRIASGKLL
ncbi:DNA repair protein RecO [Eubacteriales bacterium OttesenSCG-928-A19]|nr:DNA repair protein RecO [Eubacteriales bacterium OttesenSCG-928-A19]